MADDAYEFLSPDLLAPPQPVPPPPQNPGETGTTPDPQLATNEVAPESEAEKFQVQPAPATNEANSKSDSLKEKKKGKGKGRKKGRKTGKSRESSEPLPPVHSFKWLMIWSAILIFVSVALTLMVLIDGVLT